MAKVKMKTKLEKENKLHESDSRQGKDLILKMEQVPLNYSEPCAGLVQSNKNLTSAVLSFIDSSIIYPIRSERLMDLIE